VSPTTTREVGIPAGDRTLAGILDLPSKPLGVVMFAHGSGSSRLSPRNQAVARDLRGSGFGTLLMDLLTEEEEAEDARTGALRFGASTGAAAAIVAAAARPDRIGAVVSRGGRPDLADEALGSIRAPTLLIVGGNDPEVIELNRQALQRLAAESRLEVVPGATHLFEEPGALDEVARLASDWFVRHLRRHGSG
jgi:putative phosphoribosyl transferase